eukprot:scaffold24644_cov63-Phaeocystis_antarctica.AAC.3
MVGKLFEAGQRLALALLRRVSEVPIVTRVVEAFVIVVGRVDLHPPCRPGLDEHRNRLRDGRVFQRRRHGEDDLELVLVQNGQAGFPGVVGVQFDALGSVVCVFHQNPAPGAHLLEVPVSALSNPALLVVRARRLVARQHPSRRWVGEVARTVADGWPSPTCRSRAAPAPGARGWPGPGVALWPRRRCAPNGCRTRAHGCAHGQPHQRRFPWMRRCIGHQRAPQPLPLVASPPAAAATSVRAPVWSSAKVCKRRVQARAWVRQK